MARDAFISYSHAADGKFAPKLEAGLQRLTKPWYKIRALEVFRDEANLNLSPHLWDAIVSAMGACKYFLYLASPEAADSKWVGREVEHWLAHKERAKLLIVVTDGKIAWDESRGDFDWDATDCLPRVLAGAFSGEPLYLDMRWAREERDLSLQNPRFKEAVALVSATIQGKAVEDVIGEEVVQHRRTRRIRNFAIASLSVLLVAAVISAYIAIQQRGEAIRQRDEAVQRGLLNRVRSELANDSLLGAVQAARAGHRRFGSTPLIRLPRRDPTGTWTRPIADGTHVFCS